VDKRSSAEGEGLPLAKRDERLARPIQLSDTLAANTSVEKNVVRAYRLAHARRKVFELKDDHPAECAKDG
jgi:hypothetical protein